MSDENDKRGIWKDNSGHLVQSAGQSKALHTTVLQNTCINKYKSKFITELHFVSKCFFYQEIKHMLYKMICL